MKNRKLMLIIIVVILVIIITISCIYIVNKQNENKAKQTLVDFVNLINEKNYEGIYNKVKLSSMNKEDFINRNKNIYEGIGSSNIQVEVTNIQKENNEYKISYHEKTFTLAGEINFDNDVTITKDYKLNWSSSFIFPQLGEKEKVRISTIKANRGEILDRNDKPLAANGSILSVGIVPVILVK